MGPLDIFITLAQSWPGSSTNQGVLHTPQIPRTETSSSITVWILKTNKQTNKEMFRFSLDTFWPNFKYTKWGRYISHTWLLSRDGSQRRGVGMILFPVELKLSSSQKVTVRNDCGSHRCLHLSDLGSPDIGRGRRKWSQMIGGGTPNGSRVPFPSTEEVQKKNSFWTSLVADGRQPFHSGLKTKDWDMRDLSLSSQH